MIKEDKELLLKDLCARLPYGVKLHKTYEECNPLELRSFDIDNDKLVLYKYNGEVLTICDADSIERFGKIKYKPYLFPLSSMTEEQKQEYTYIVNYISPDDTDNWKEGEFIYVEQFAQLMHFYHINHLDYMGLIEKGLAIDATGLNVY